MHACLVQAPLLPIPKTIINLFSIVNFNILEKASHCKASARDIPTINNVEQNTGPSQLCSEKPLYLSSTENLALVRRRRVIECQAYEADRSWSLEINIEL
ncbi:hypothetical protein GLYMA_01G114550v4 [Glycine max]|nr:hypothetical protein GLYMA_01G114550v4 [Glycine max]KAH1162661.1 hypothetical protein GYH30_001241 [Glycine max]